MGIVSLLFNFCFQDTLKLPELNFVTTDQYGFLKLEPSRDMGKFFILGLS